MADLETAVADWKRAFLNSTPANHPTVWVSFYNPTHLGAMWLYRPDDREAAALWLSAPFVFTEVEGVFIACDTAHNLRISRLLAEGRGVRCTNWLVGYGLDDSGVPRFEPASYEHQPAFPVVVDKLMQWRPGTDKVGFEVAFEAARQWANVTL